MITKSIVSTIWAVVFIAAAPFGQAAPLLFNLDTNSCTTGCLVSRAGQISLTQIAINSVNVSITLDPNYSFRKSNDANHKSVEFTLNPSLASVAIQSITANQTFVATGPVSGNLAAGFGSFSWYLQCTTCVSGVPSTPTSSLSFNVVSTGINLNSFQVNSSSWYFAVDVVGITAISGAGNTGNFGAGDPIPEPGTASMFVVAFCLAGCFVRRSSSVAVR